MDGFSLNATRPLPPPKTAGLPSSPKVFLTPSSFTSSTTTLQPAIYSPPMINEAWHKSPSLLPSSSKMGHSRSCSAWSATTAATSCSSPALKDLESEFEPLHPRPSHQPVGLGIEALPQPTEPPRKQRHARSKSVWLFCCFGADGDLSETEERPRKKKVREPLELVPDGHWTEL